MFWQNDSEVNIHWKGAAEIVLASCSRFVDLCGEQQPIDGEKVHILFYTNESILLKN